MITNLPTSTDFENVAKQCLTQAFNVVYEIDKNLVYVDEVPPEDVWEYHLGDLSTSLILVYQAIESLMKARICQESTLLLIDLRRTDWPTRPDQADRDFNELFTIGGEALQKTYAAAISPARADNTLMKFIDDIRLTRNKIIHGVSREYLDPEYLIEIILNTYSYFLGKDSWWLTMRELHINNPLFGIFNNNYEEAHLIEKLDYVEKIVDKAEFRKHFSLNLKSRRYYCPWCQSSLTKEDDVLETQWALLIPQKKKGATKIKCINCQRIQPVIRQKCNQTDCKGDVISDEGVCLTCNCEQ